MTAIDARTARRRYLVLIALRWLPTGLLIPVLALLMVSRATTAMLIGGIVCAAAAPLYIPAWRAERRRPMAHPRLPAPTGMSDSGA